MNDLHSRDQRPADELAFGERLRQEARATEPAFSERLHRDICQAMRQSHAGAVSRQLAQGAWETWRWGALAAAAVLLVALFVAWGSRKLSLDWQPNPPAVDPASVAGADSLARPLLPGLMDRAALEVDRLIAEKIVGEQWSYLEHDAGVLANAVTGGSLRRLVHPAGNSPEPSSLPFRPEG